MSEELVVKLEVFRLSHVDGHHGCDYVVEARSDVDFTLNDSPVALLFATCGNSTTYFLTIDESDRVRIRIKPQTSDLFPVEAQFIYRGEGRFDRLDDAAAARAGVARPEGCDLLGFLPEAFRMVLFRGFLPTILDVTTKVRDELRKQAIEGSWKVAVEDPDFDIIEHLERAADAHWIADPPVDQPGGTLQYEEASVDPQTSLRVFELAGAPRVPGLVFVSLPRDLEPDLLEEDADKRLSCLLMLRPILGAYYAASPYPYGINYLWDAGLKYMGLLGLDPILQKYPDGRRLSGYRDHPPDDDSSLQHVGLPHQVAAGGRRAAVIFPMGRGASFGRFENADFVHEFIHEVYAWELRAQEFHVAPGAIGPCAVAGFSSGNQLLATWLNNNAGRRFADEVVRELYSIDAPIGTHALEQIVDAAEAWVKRGPSDKAIRVYNQAGVHSKLDGFKPPGTNFPRVPYEMSVGATRTVVATPAVALSKGAAGIDPGYKKRWPSGYGGGDREAHQIINATMFVDALRRSSFPKL